MFKLNAHDALQGRCRRRCKSSSSTGVTCKRREPSIFSANLLVEAADVPGDGKLEEKAGTGSCSLKSLTSLLGQGWQSANMSAHGRCGKRSKSKKVLKALARQAAAVTAMRSGMLLITRQTQTRGGCSGLAASFAPKGRYSQEETTGRRSILLQPSKLSRPVWKTSCFLLHSAMPTGTLFTGERCTRGHGHSHSARVYSSGTSHVGQHLVCNRKSSKAQRLRGLLRQAEDEVSTSEGWNHTTVKCSDSVRKASLPM